MKAKLILTSIFVFCSILMFAQNRQFEPTKHYTGIVNTGNNMTLGIKDEAWIDVPQKGDEIGVFNQSGVLCGSSVYLGGHTAVAIWGDDETTKEREGIPVGERFIIKLWRSSSNSESLIEVESWLEGDNSFETNGISVINKLKIIPLGNNSTDFALLQNVPNPAKESTSIEYSLPVSTYVEISLYTANGEFVKKIVSENKPAGKYSVKFDTSEYASGSYYYKLTTSEKTLTKYMNIVK